MVMLTAFILSLAGVFLLVKLPQLHVALDTPNMRSLHQKITPRTGGIGLLFGLIVTWVFLGADLRLLLLCLFLAGLSLLDDIRGLPVFIRFSAHFFAATVFTVLFVGFNEFFSLTLVIVSMVWMINLYNFMDGSDGLAGGMALFGFASYAVAAYVAHDVELALLSACVASSSLAFLFFNFNPAKIFMGDAGSITLGFLVGAIGFLGVERHLWAWWFTVLVFSPFIVDATVTILKRLLNGEKIWQAHKSHYYQRLILMGWTHKKTAIVEYVLMLCVGCTAISIVECSPFVQWFALLFWCLVYLLMMAVIDKKWHNFQKHNTI